MSVKKSQCVCGLYSTGPAPASGVHLKTQQGAGLFLQHTHTEGPEDLGSRGPAKAVRICRAGKANLGNPSRLAGRHFKGERETE